MSKNTAQLLFDFMVQEGIIDKYRKDIDWLDLDRLISGAEGGMKYGKIPIYAQIP